MFDHPYFITLNRQNHSYFHQPLRFDPYSACDARIEKHFLHKPVRCRHTSYWEVLFMANKKYRPGMNCEKTGKYSRYNADGKCVGEDIDVEKGRRFPPAQEEGCYYKEQ